MANIKRLAKEVAASGKRGKDNYLKFLYNAGSMAATKPAKFIGAMDKASKELSPLGRMNRLRKIAKKKKK